MKRVFALAVSLCILVGSFAGCSKIGIGLKPKKFNQDKSPAYLQSGIVSENDTYALEWNDSSKQIKLVDKVKNIIWSSNPSSSKEPELDEFGMPIKSHPLLSSDIAVKYVEEKTGNVVSVNSYVGANSGGRISAELIKNGIKVEYYFDELQFTVPVEYVLRDDGLELTVKTKNIQEKENRITEISVLPFMCSVENNATDSYLFVPSGSGAIIYPKDISSQGDSFRQEIYGKDLMIRDYTETSKKDNIYLSVFGAKKSENVICAIVENGAESALIEATVGSQSYKYSSVYTTVCVRGYDELRSVNYSGATLVTDYYTEDMADLEFTVCYKPLYDGEANYNGMAKEYREFLIENEGLKNHKIEDLTYGITLNGGFMTTKSFLGVPYETLYKLTTLSQAREIISELYSQTKQAPVVRLKGYGQTGLDIGKIAGGYKINSSLGGKKQLTKFFDYCEENGIDTYLNFDILRFKNNGNDWSRLYDSAKSATGKNYYPSGYTVAMRDKNISTEFVLLSRNQIYNSALKLLEKTEKLNISGYSLDALGTEAYSDYSSGESFSKSNLSRDIKKAINVFNKEDKRVAVSGANAYAAANATQIFDTPLSSARFDLFDEDIPFYQMVFKGYISMASTPLNSATLENDALLACIESGTIPLWSLMYDYDNSALNFTSSELRNGVYSRYKQSIIDTVEQTSDYFTAIKDAQIVNHSIIENGVRITEFSNGVTAIVNRGNKSVQTPLGTLDAGEYIIGGIDG